MRLVWLACRPSAQYHLYRLLDHLVCRRAACNSHKTQASKLRQAYKVLTVKVLTVKVLTRFLQSRFLRLNIFGLARAYALSDGAYIRSDGAYILSDGACICGDGAYIDSDGAYIGAVVDW